MLTFIGKYGLTCLTKETADRLARGVDQHVVADHFGYKLKIDGCIGDDFEEMIDDIKRREFIWRNGVGCYNKWYHGNYRNFKFFHVASLTPEEQRKLESKDSVFAKQFANGIPDFRKPHRLPFHTQTKSDTKYRLSICTRRTFLITNCEPYHSCKSNWDRCTEQINFY